LPFSFTAFGGGFGFGGIAVGAAGIAKILFIVFLIGAVVTFLMSLGRRA